MDALINHLITNKITPNALVQLHAFHNNLAYPKYLNTFTEICRLEDGGFIKIREEMVDNTRTLVNGKMYEITAKGLSILESASKFVVSKKTAAKTMKTVPENWNANIEIYRMLFPPGATGGRAYRSNPKDCLPKFIWFFEEYPHFTWDDVFNATQMYIAKIFAGDATGTFCRRAVYFIKKQELDKSIISDLADWCQMYKDGGHIEEAPAYLKTKVV